MASAMPAVDTWLPRRAVAGEFIRCRPSTKQTAAATYRSWVDPVEAAHEPSRSAARGRAWPSGWPSAAWPPPAPGPRRNILSIRPVTT